MRARDQIKGILDGAPRLPATTQGFHTGEACWCRQSRACVQLSPGTRSAVWGVCHRWRPWSSRLIGKAPWWTMAHGGDLAAVACHVPSARQLHCRGRAPQEPASPAKIQYIKSSPCIICWYCTAIQGLHSSEQSLHAISQHVPIYGDIKSVKYCSCCCSARGYEGQTYTVVCRALDQGYQHHKSFANEDSLLPTQNWFNASLSMKRENLICHLAAQIFCIVGLLM